MDHSIINHSIIDHSTNMSPDTQTKTIRRLEDAGYSATQNHDDSHLTCSSDDGEESPKWYIRPLDECLGHDPIVILSFDISKGMIIIHEAWNQHDDPIKTLKLRDMIISAWVYVAEQTVTYLKTIKYQTVVEAVAGPKLPTVYADLTKPSDGPNIYMEAAPELQDECGDVVKAVLIPSPRPEGLSTEQGKVYSRAWPTLAMLPFSRGIRAMLKEYPQLAGRCMESFVITECGVFNGLHQYADFYINLGGQGPSTQDLARMQAEAEGNNQRLPFIEGVKRKFEALAAINEYMKITGQLHLGADEICAQSYKDRVLAGNIRTLQVYDWVQRSDTRYNHKLAPMQQPRVKEVVEILQVLQLFIFDKWVDKQKDPESYTKTPNGPLHGKPHLQEFFDGLLKLGRKMHEVNSRTSRLKYQDLPWPTWPSAHHDCGHATVHCECPGTTNNRLYARIVGVVRILQEKKNKPFDPGLVVNEDEEARKRRSRVHDRSPSPKQKNTKKLEEHKKPYKKREQIGGFLVSCLLSSSVCLLSVLEKCMSGRRKPTKLQNHTKTLKITQTRSKHGQWRRNTVFGLSFSGQMYVRSDQLLDFYVLERCMSASRIVGFLCSIEMYVRSKHCWKQGSYVLQLIYIKHTASSHPVTCKKNYFSI